MSLVADDHVARYAVQPGQQGPPAVVIGIDPLQGADKHRGGEVLGRLLVKYPGPYVAEDSGIVRVVNLAPRLRRTRLRPAGPSGFVRFGNRYICGGSFV